MICKNPNCGYFYHCFNRRNKSDFIPPCKKDEAKQDMRGDKHETN